MFEYQHIRTANIEEDGELVKALDPSGDRGTLQQVNDYIDPFTPGRVQKGILNVLGSLLFHDPPLKRLYFFQHYSR